MFESCQVSSRFVRIWELCCVPTPVNVLARNQQESQMIIPGNYNLQRPSIFRVNDAFSPCKMFGPCDNATIRVNAVRFTFHAQVEGNSHQRTEGFRRCHPPNTLRIFPPFSDKPRLPLSFMFNSSYWILIED